jgi:hypothetical protein
MKADIVLSLKLSNDMVSIEQAKVSLYEIQITKYGISNLYQQFGQTLWF